MQSFVLLIWLTLCAVQDARQRHIAYGLTLGAGALGLATDGMHVLVRSFVSAATGGGAVGIGFVAR